MNVVGFLFALSLGNLPLGMPTRTVDVQILELNHVEKLNGMGFAPFQGTHQLIAWEYRPGAEREGSLWHTIPIDWICVHRNVGKLVRKKYVLLYHRGELLRIRFLVGWETWTEQDQFVENMVEYRRKVFHP